MLRIYTLKLVTTDALITTKKNDGNEFEFFFFLLAEM